MLPNKLQEFSWNTAQGTKIYAVHWPVDKARAVVGLIHGLGEHCRRYDHLGAFFQSQGIAMIGYDRQGYGRSGGRRGYVENFNYYLDSISRLVVECETHYPDRPVYLYGHSLGGGLLLKYITERQPDIAGAIGSAAYIRLGFPPPQLKIGLGKLMRSVWPTFTQSAPLDQSKLSRIAEVVAAYKADPLVHAQLSAQTGIDIFDMGIHLDQLSTTINLPLLMMHGKADEITAHDGSEDFASRTKGADIQFKSWTGFYHELHNEPEQQDVMKFVLDWLNERIPNANSHRRLKSV